MKTLRFSLRFLLPLGLILAAAVYIAQPLLEQETRRRFSQDLQSRGALVANALSGLVAHALQVGDTQMLVPVFERTLDEERLHAIAVCSLDGRRLQSNAAFPASLGCAHSSEIAAHQDPRLALTDGVVRISVHDVVLHPDPPAQPTVMGRLVLLHDEGYMEKRSQITRNYLMGFVTLLGTLVALATMAVAQLSWRGWLKGMHAAVRGVAAHSPQPAASELRRLQDEYRRTQGPDGEWNAERLRALLRTHLSGDQVIVVSNREPYLHEHTDHGLLVKRPASGLVTAVEPVMRACSGTWIAHGSGDADRQVVDAQDCVAVPPGHEDYLLRRIWLTKEEEQGYYYGFANEGLWPLCLLAHVRPVFRASDWKAYKAVNQRFADAVVAQARSVDPLVLVQDYHFALLPAMVRQMLPQATILSFWHIPWPNPETFGICPWRREILQGMLGSTIVGFHTRFHCKNFLDTVDRYLEARIETEHSSIRYQNDITLVQSYPISIAWPPPEQVRAWPAVAECRARVVERLGLAHQGLCLAVGIDRFDYTKGILERIQAVECMLEQAPQWVGRFVFLQIAAPTRGALAQYRGYQEQVANAVQRVNQRFGKPGYQPVHMFAKHHEAQALNELFRAADMCVVTSLHDGMNLVCKEFVAARDDLQGVLVLSQFAGAAQELTEALLVNPYHLEETANAMLRAASMPAAEQRERMGSLRNTVRECNVFRWAAHMLSDAGRWRLKARVEARVRSYSNTQAVP